MRNVVIFVFALCVLAPLAAQPVSSATGSKKLPARVPFVGCRSDGQTGPVEAPSGESKPVPIAAETAQRLAYYHAEQGPGVLAPRGWYCFGTYGSNGEVLYISPQPIDATSLLSPQGAGFTGPVIEFAHMVGDTSGRFSVARTIARVFPAHRAFVSKVAAEGIWPADAFPSGPYPQDKLTYKSKEMVEYQTPAQTEGLGTNSRLLKNSSPISGVAILVGEPPDLLFLSMRLPLDLGGLAAAIIRQVERDAARPVTSRGSAAPMPGPTIQSPREDRSQR